VAAGDTVRWIVGDSESGAGQTKQVHILVKPTSADIATNLVIATDRRTYHLELRSLERAYMAEVAWRYPTGALVALRGAPLQPPPHKEPTESPAPAAEPDLAALDFSYRIDGRAPWRPVRVFSDGRRTAIDFPAEVSAGELPPLFILGAKGEPELVNYRVLGRRMIVDRIFQKAELRLGTGSKAAVVSLTHEDPTKR
jgi:type IV secretion system protein VirB9